MNKKILSMVIFSIAMSDVSGVESGKLEKAFVTPPREAQAWCYWWWLNDVASNEGITRD